MSLETKAAHEQWKAGFIRIAGSQSFFSLLGSGSCLLSNYYTPDNKLLVVAALLGSLLPYTYIFMMKTNTILLSPKCESDSPRTRSLLEYWSLLHSVRTLIGLAAMGIILYNY